MALGYPSWTAYLADVFTLQVRFDREQRRELVGYLSGEGMSQRAIADVVGVGVGTVNRDLDAGVPNGTPQPDVDDPVVDELIAQGLVESADEYHDIMAMADVPEDQFEEVLVEAREQDDLSRENVARLARERTVEQEPITGRDGKSYPRSAPKPPAPQPEPEIVDAEIPDYAGDDTEIAPGLTGKQLHAINQKVDAPPSAPTLGKPRRKPITDQACTAGWELRKSVERIERIAADDRFDPQIEKVAPPLRGHLKNAIEVCQDVLGRLDLNTIRAYIEPGLGLGDEAEDQGDDEEAQPQIGPDYIDSILPLFAQTFGPHRLERFDESERRRVTDAMKEALQKLEELEGDQSFSDRPPRRRGTDDRPTAARSR